MARIRTARVEDGAQIARVHVAAWQAGYRGKMPDDFLNQMDPSERGQAWSRLLENGGGRGVVVFGSSPATVLVAENDAGEIVGISSFGPARQSGQLLAGELTEDGAGELMMINFEPESWGSGLPQQLLDKVTRSLAASGYREAVLWVLDSNERARRFYEKAGWLPDGGEKLDERPGFSLRELRYRRRLGHAQP